MMYGDPRAAFGIERARDGLDPVAVGAKSIARPGLTLPDNFRSRAAYRPLMPSSRMSLA